MARSPNNTPFVDVNAADPKNTRLTSFSPEHSLPHAFSVITNRISHKLEMMYSEVFGISVIDWRIIAILGHHSPLSAKALAELTAMDQVSISRALEHLTNKKLVIRKVDLSDRRRVAISLSKKGIDIYDQVVPLLYASESALVANLDLEEEIIFRRILDKMLQKSEHIFSKNADWRTILDEY